ncbi:MAG: NAD-dependent epimerase/dehydratase family protein, partial [Gaiellaceae bacterium]
MKVAVSGASGLIGSALVPVLRAGGHEVTRLVRRAESAADEIRWDPAAADLDASTLHGVDAIVNLSGENIGQRWTESRKREILESRTSATSLLARTAARLEPQPSVFVCAGGIGIYGDRGDEIVTEEST